MPRDLERLFDHGPAIDLSALELTTGLSADELSATRDLTAEVIATVAVLVRRRFRWWWALAAVRATQRGYGAISRLEPETRVLLATAGQEVPDEDEDEDDEAEGDDPENVIAPTLEQVRRIDEMLQQRSPLARKRFATGLQTAAEAAAGTKASTGQLDFLTRMASVLGATD